MPTNECRLDKIEERVCNLIRELNEDKAENKDTLKSIHDNISLILEQSQKQSGFLAGLTFAVSAVVGIIGLLWGKP